MNSTVLYTLPQHLQDVAYVQCTVIILQSFIPSTVRNVYLVVQRKSGEGGVRLIVRTCVWLAGDGVTETQPKDSRGDTRHYSSGLHYCAVTLVTGVYSYSINSWDFIHACQLPILVEKIKGRFYFRIGGLAILVEFFKIMTVADTAPGNYNYSNSASVTWELSWRCDIYLAPREPPRESEIQPKRCDRRNFLGF